MSAATRRDKEARDFRRPALRSHILRDPASCPTHRQVPAQLRARIRNFRRVTELVNRVERLKIMFLIPPHFELRRGREAPRLHFLSLRLCRFCAATYRENDASASSHILSM